MPGEQVGKREPRGLIIVSSWHHGNTAQVARAMGDELKSQVLSVEEVQATDLSEWDLIGFGSGIYFASHDRKLLELVRRATGLPARAFVFSTAGNTLLWRWYHRALRHLLQARGCQIAGEFNCPGWDTVGPFWLFGGFYRGHPNEQDLEKAREFCRQLRTGAGREELASR
ncbi:MAG: flavodoxin domain-containing protein [Planctomycetota bacterium]